MAKGKSKKGTSKQVVKMSPERYIREKARQLPIDKCYINGDWKEKGLAQIVVTRKKANGNYVVGVYLVDTFCMGVKDTFCRHDMSDDEILQMNDKISGGVGLEEIPYIEAHNLIYGGIAFAEDADIPPHKDFTLSKYVLEEDTDDIPLIEYEYGRDGKYFLVVGPNSRDKLYLERLHKKFGNDFDYIYDIPGVDAEKLKLYDMMQWGLQRMKDNRKKYPSLKYNYLHPEYPQTLNVKNQFIIDEFSKKENNYMMPQVVIDRILSLPPDQVATDLSNLILYEIGRTYNQIEEEIEVEGNFHLMHAIIFLALIDSNKALGAILEILRQTSEFADFHFGDIAPEYLFLALAMAGKNDINKIEQYLYEPGYESYMRIQGVYALATILQTQPERRDEIIEVLRRLLLSIKERIGALDTYDGDFAGFVMSVLMDIQAVELIPEVKQLFATGKVNPTIAGELDEVLEGINDNDPEKREYREAKHAPMSIEAQYRHLHSFAPDRVD